MSHSFFRPRQKKAFSLLSAFLLLSTASLLTTGQTGFAQTQSGQSQTSQPSSQEVSVSSSQETSSTASSSQTSLSPEAPLASETSASTSASSQEESAATAPASSTQTSSPSLSLEQYAQADATALAEKVRKGEVSSQELVRLALEMIEKTNGDLNNVITLRAEEALKEAQELKDTGQPFLGVPILVKGLGHTIKGGESTNGLPFLEGSTSKTTGRYVKALQDAGFIVIGQTSYPEMGWINVTHSQLYGLTHNPWNLAHNPGGSSGGASAAVAAGQVPIASASDGGGSIRIPAAWSGTIGFFPTIGLTTGTSATTYNNVGNFAETKSMRDTEALFNALLTKQVLGNQLSKDKPIAYTRATPAGTSISPEALKALDQAVDFLKSQGYQLVEVPYPVDGEKLIKSYYTLASSGASVVNYLAKQKLKRNLQIGDASLLSWALYQTGKDLTRDDLQTSHDTIDQARQQMETFYQTYPVFLTPTNAHPAPAADYDYMTPAIRQRIENMEKLSKEEKLQLIYDQWLPAWELTPYTQLANLTQTPAISLPTYVTADGLPMGIMFNSYKNNDRTLLALGYLFEEAGLFQSLSQYRNRQTTDPKTSEETDSRPAVQAVNTTPQDQTDFLREADPQEVQRLANPVKAKAQLPKTNSQNSSLFYSLGLCLLLTGLVLLKKKKLA